MATTAAEDFITEIKERFVGKELTDVRLTTDRVGDPQINFDFANGRTIPVRFDHNGCEGGACDALMKVGGRSLQTLLEED